MKLFTIALTLFLCGCSTAMYSSSNNASYAKFLQDRSDCVQKNQQIGLIGDISCNAFQACLASKGYFQNSSGNLSSGGAEVWCSAGGLNWPK
jgi:hypothetical protein